MLSARHSRAASGEGLRAGEGDTARDPVDDRLGRRRASCITRVPAAPMSSSPDPTAAPAPGAMRHDALPSRHVFVYGTLRRGEMNDIHRLQPAPRFVGMAQVRGTLYDLGAYPGLRLHGDAAVVGEVYAIDASLEPQLDAIEEIRGRADDEYLKRRLTVVVAQQPLEVLLYEVQPHRVAGAPVIASGDWLQR